MDHYEENREKSKKQVDAFIRYWNAYKSSHVRPGTIDWWRGYLLSEEFQNIRFHPQVVQLLAGERAWRCMKHDFFHTDYMTDEIKSLLWEAYGFQEDDKNAYQGEVQKLWIYLHPKRIRRRMQGRRKRLVRGAAIIFILLISICGAYLTNGGKVNNGKVLAWVVILLLYCTVNLFGNMRE